MLSLGREFESPPATGFTFSIPLFFLPSQTSFVLVESLLANR